MTHNIFGYKGFTIKIIPYQVVTSNSAARAHTRYAVSVVILGFSYMPGRRREIRCYPGGMYLTLEQAFACGKEYATHVIDDDFPTVPVLTNVAY